MRAMTLLVLAVSTVAALPPRAAAQSPAGPPQPQEAPAAAAANESRAARVRRLEAERRRVRLEVEAARARMAGGAPASEQQALEGRIAELERRVRELEAELARLRDETVRALPGTQTPADPVGLQPVDLFGQRGQVTAGSAFNPAISVIPDGVYYADNRQGAATRIASDAAGFHAHGGQAGGHSHGDVERGFTLRELEVTFSGAVDPYFDVWAVLAVGSGEIEAEEAYVQTRQFIPGLQLRFGKFYSGLGYLNRQHPHQWDFVDQALPYQLLFDGSVNEVGVQVNWLPPLPVYALFGFEALQGENARVSQHLGPEAAEGFRDRAGPRLFTGFVKVSPDIGYSGGLQFGASAGRSTLHQELHEEAEGAEALEGHVTFLGADVVYKYDSGKQWGVGDLTLQGEYLWRKRSLGVIGVGAEPAAAPRLNFAQDGLYLQAVYGFAPRWTAGFRFDSVGLINRVDDGSTTIDDESSRRYSANVTFNPTEFSRLRVQYTRGDFAAEAGRETYHQLWVQFQMSLGAHGAHRF